MLCQKEELYCEKWWAYLASIQGSASRWNHWDTCIFSSVAIEDEWAWHDKSILWKTSAGQAEVNRPAEERIYTIAHCSDSFQKRIDFSFHYHGWYRQVQEERS